jgi:hypothetical protein
MWGLRGLPLREIGVDHLVHARSRCSPLDGDNILQGPYNSHDACLGITCKGKMNQGEDEANYIIQVGDNIGGVFPLHKVDGS